MVTRIRVATCARGGMYENRKRFVCHWHTAIDPGITYYEGRETLWAKDENDAVEHCQFNVQRRAFPDYSPSHIVVTKVYRQ